MQPVDEALRDEVIQQMLGATSLQVAFIGASHRLFEALDAAPATPGALAEALGLDPGYLTRWCDAAYAFELLDADDAGVFRPTARGRAFRADVPGSLGPFALHAALAGHMAERAAALLPSGERPGESVLVERPTLAAGLGALLEGSFGGLFSREVLPAVAALQRLRQRGGRVVDLGCGNGWYLRRLADGAPGVHGLGVDGFDGAIAEARDRAAAAGLADRLSFATGDLPALPFDGPADVITMNRALHHVWGEDDGARGAFLAGLAERLAPGGALVIWEPAWPTDRAALRQPPLRGVAFQNLAEHIQGNRFLTPVEIAAALEAVGLDVHVDSFAGGREAVLTGTRGST